MTTLAELQTISAICNRAIKEHPSISRKLDLFMDIDFTHQETPLDLDQLLAFPAGDFNHDIDGIIANFNRDTLTMDNCFSPRCTIPTNRDEPDLEMYPGGAAHRDVMGYND